MALFSEAGCILRVDLHCEQCKYKILEVLSSIVGVYNVDMDGERGLVKIFGEVDPNILLRAVARTGRHAEVVRMNFRHPSWAHTSSYYAGPLGYNHLPTSYPLDYCHQYYPFHHTTGYGCGLPPRYLVPFRASYGHGLVHTRRGYGGLYGGGSHYSYGGSYYSICNHF